MWLEEKEGGKKKKRKRHARLGFYGVENVDVNRAASKLFANRVVKTAVWACVLRHDDGNDGHLRCG